jgi:hypothetical protein
MGRDTNEPGAGRTSNPPCHPLSGVRDPFPPVIHQ